MSGMDPRRMEPRLIKDISKEISTEFSMLRIYLGFTEAQFARLKHAYRNMDDQIFAMLNAWHDVVVRCGENPRRLLAAALDDCENRFLAVTKLVTPKELDGLKPREREPREETKKLIEEINFTVPGDMAGAGPIFNVGAPNAVNVFPGGSLSNHGKLSLGINYPGVSRSSGADSNPKHGNFKKSNDDSLTQTMLGIYHNMMESVGAIMAHNYVFGTGFRVGSKYIMTAKHVITDILDPYRSGVITDQYMQDAHISFSDLPTVPSDLDYKFKQVCYFNEKLDIAILEILNPDQRLPNKLPLRRDNLPDIEYVSLFGYGHPNNPRKHWDQRCQIIYPNFECLRSALAFKEKRHQDLIQNLDRNYVVRLRSKNENPAAVVEKGYLGYDEPHKLLIHAFLEHGASGSPMLACVNPAAGIVQVVGVFTHGIPEFYFCLSDTGKSIIPNEFRFEAGTRMTFIFQDMCREHVSLAQDIFT
ncbi:uncharacterized protein LOC127857538 [Dreissena polymorpha]|uniref:Uncharacterized protein n=1 Tax=Dreissena polymorpha TaxID=45954 RepID=A0A9D3Z1T6_DREPO|nr:uncharacterized protein LOC127857538 [Dreissena polymorpha]XP_052249936.1 uncharacterized protein LOC127857538 [Dreissena polymorpha]XP_052249937.1 uncharacterized protein LOC127857538 [Dreissena polymorpha]KAH3711193.1 hypothetical protein DPMN_070694 [Dreissena polymorpha]